MVIDHGYISPMKKLIKTSTKVVLLTGIIAVTVTAMLSVKHYSKDTSILDTL